MTVDNLSIPIIELRNVTKTYKTTSNALDDISIRISQPGVWGILGPNGAGKTTLMRVIGGITCPTHGLVTILGHDVVEHPIKAKERIAFVTQSAGLARQLTVEENIFWYLRILGYRPKQAHSKTFDALEQFGLYAHRSKYSHQLSGGLRRRVQLAQVFARETPILILDEPTVGLDPEARRDVWEHISLLQNKRKTTILLCSQSMEEAEALCGYVCLMTNGRSLKVASVQELKNLDSSESLEVTIGSARDAAFLDGVRALPLVEDVQLKHDALFVVTRKVDQAAIEVLGYLSRVGIDALSIKFNSRSLESAYLHLVKEGVPSSVN